MMINFFKNLNLHDTPVKSFEIDFYESIFLLVFLHYDEENHDYFETTLKFQDIKNFHLGDFGSITECEITTFEVTEIADYYSVNFTMLSDIELYPVELSFSFSTVNVNYPSGRKPKLK